MSSFNSHYHSRSGTEADPSWFTNPANEPATGGRNIELANRHRNANKPYVTDTLSSSYSGSSTNGFCSAPPLFRTLFIILLLLVICLAGAIVYLLVFRSSSNSSSSSSSTQSAGPSAGAGAALTGIAMSSNAAVLSQYSFLEDDLPSTSYSDPTPNAWVGLRFPSLNSLSQVYMIVPNGFSSSFQGAKLEIDSDIACSFTNGSPSVALLFTIDSNSAQYPLPLSGNQWQRYDVPAAMQSVPAQCTRIAANGGNGIFLAELRFAGTPFQPRSSSSSSTGSAAISSTRSTSSSSAAIPSSTLALSSTGAAVFSSLSPSSTRATLSSSSSSVSSIASAPISNTSSITLIVKRFAPGSSVTPVSAGIPLLLRDPFTTVANCSLWIQGQEVPIYIEPLTGNLTDGKPISLLIQWDQVLSNLSSSTAVLNFAMPPQQARLSRRNIIWPIYTSPNPGYSEYQDRFNRADFLRSLVPTNMEGIAMRQSSDFVDWQGWRNPLVSWGSFTPTAAEIQYKNAMDYTLPYMFGGEGIAFLTANQYSRVYLESARAAMTGDIDGLIRAIRIFGGNYATYYVSSVYSNSDSAGSFSFGPGSEPYHASHTGAIAYLLFGCDWARDVLVIGMARQYAFNTNSVGYIVSRTRYDVSYNQRQVARGLMDAAWACKVGARDRVYNGKTGLQWARELATNLLSHDGWEVMPVGMRLMNSVTGSILAGQLTNHTESWKVALAMNEALHIHTHPLLGGPIPGMDLRLKVVVDRFVNLSIICQYDVNNNPQTFTWRSVPYFDGTVDNVPYATHSPDLMGFFPSLYQYVHRVYSGSYDYQSAGDYWIGLIGCGCWEGPYLNARGTSSEKVTQEAFAYGIHHFGWKYGGWN